MTDITTMKTNYHLLEGIYNKCIDLNALYTHSEGLRYMLVRSLTKPILSSILSTVLSNENHSKKKIDDLRFQVFENIPVNTLVAYLKTSKTPMEPTIIRQLTTELKQLCNIDTSSVHQDNFNTNMNQIIRNPDTNSYIKLQTEVDDILVKQLKNYVLWQWYNQKCSDMVENLILTQSAIIQTPRKIKYIDFFVEDGETIFPFDLKLTIFPKGFIKDEKIANAAEYIRDKKNHTKLLEWLYTEQNPRLFSNNYRYFIILLDTAAPDQSYKLKCDLELIQTSVDAYFTQFSSSDIHNITYEYKKDKTKSGVYTTKCMYSIISR